MNNLDMNRRRTFLLLFSATVAVLLVVLMITYANLERFSRTHQAIRSGHLTLRVLESVLSSIKGTETALKEYRELGDTAALISLSDARRELNMNLELIAVLVTDKQQVHRVDSLIRMVPEAFMAMEPVLRSGAHPSDSLRQRTVDDALALLRSSRGLHGRLVRAEEGVLKGSRDREQRISLSTPLLLLAFALLTIVAVSLLFIKVYKASGKAERAEHQLKGKVDELDSEVRTREFAERSLKRVLDSSISGIMVFRSVRDKDGRIRDLEWIMVNRQAALMLDKPENDLIGKRMLDVLPAMKGSGLFRQYIEVINTKKALHLHNAPDMNGLEGRLDMHAVKLADGIVVTCTDVSDRERQQAVLRESERLALTGKIARTVAHEVRNPLTNVLLALDQLKEEEGMATLQPLTDIIQRNIDRIAQLITEMLDSSRPRETIRVPCEIGAILKGTVEV
ncbi:MAG TPA: histidine kinase dimerization/phospho-acceptor domain-containing protein, partial [Flavobacteriales bacterium]|nr:histidine kinase dimerization/phospho-acceptor domain-containing protein [Flavobacteriales bacterium]